MTSPHNNLQDSNVPDMFDTYPGEYSQRNNPQGTAGSEQPQNEHCEMEDGYCKRFIRLVDNDGNHLGCPWSDCPHDTRHTSAPAPAAGMVLPEEMPFTPEEIPQKKCVILESEWRQLFDAWMRSDRDVRILHKIQSSISNRPISIGHVSGCDCASCHKYKSSGYYLCEDCYNQHDAAIRSEAAKAAREQTIEDLQNYYSSLPEHEASCPFDEMNSDECQGMEGDCETCILNHAVDSLRSQQEPQKNALKPSPCIDCSYNNLPCSSSNEKYLGICRDKEEWLAQQEAEQPKEERR